VLSARIHFRFLCKLSVYMSRLLISPHETLLAREQLLSPFAKIKIFS
jgi:hypothetical protein